MTVPDAVPKATVVVADAELHTSLSIIRSLARVGLRIVAVARRQGFGTLSRWPVVRRIIEPDCDYATAILRAAADHQAVAVFAHFEATLLALHEQRSRAGPVVVGPQPVHLRAAMKKSDVLSRAAELGLRVPRTVVLTRGDRNGLAPMKEAFDSPELLYAKSDTEVGVDPGPGSRYVVVRGPEDHGALQDLIERRERVLVQDYVHGYGAGVAGFFWQGQPLCVGGHVRLRESHATGGASTYCESRIVPAAWEASMVLMESLSWTGQAMVEFKITPGKDAVLMELNPRVWGSLPLYIASGLDVPLSAYRAMVLGEAVPSGEMREGLRMRMLISDLRAVLSQTRGTNRIAKLAGVMASTPWLVNDYVFSWRDPAPFLHSIAPPAVERTLSRWLRTRRDLPDPPEGRQL